MHLRAFQCMLDHDHRLRRQDLAGDQGDALPVEKKVHAQQCDKNRNIKAKDISNIATIKMGCPEEKTTKLAKL